MQRPAHTPLGYAWQTFERAKQVFDMGRWGPSAVLFDTALKKFRQLLEDEGCAMCNAAIAAALNNNGEPYKALPYALEALDFYRELDLSAQLAEQAQNIALIYSALGREEEAEDHHLLAADKFRFLHQYEQAGKNAHAAANLCARRRNLAQARKNFITAIELLEQAGTPTSDHARATALMQLAYLEKLDNKSEGSLLLYREALELFEELESPQGIGTCREGLAAVELETNLDG